MSLWSNGSCDFWAGSHFCLFCPNDLLICILIPFNRLISFQVAVCGLQRGHLYLISVFVLCGFGWNLLCWVVMTHTCLLGSESGSSLSIFTNKTLHIDSDGDLHTVRVWLSDSLHHMFCLSLSDMCHANAHEGWILLVRARQLIAKQRVGNITAFLPHSHTNTLQTFRLVPVNYQLKCCILLAIDLPCRCYSQSLDSLWGTDCCCWLWNQMTVVFSKVITISSDGLYII